jgi:calcium/calmodulin-dependent protein kinase I
MIVTGKMSAMMQRISLDNSYSLVRKTDRPARQDENYLISPVGTVLTFLKEALAHRWLSGENATDHNLLPEIKAYMAKARLRRGIEIVKLANRIEALKMQEDEFEDTPGQADVPSDSQAAAEGAPSQESQGAGGETSSGGKKNLASLAKGAIFREVVLAKVKEAKEQEHTLQLEKDAQEKAAKSNSYEGGN